MNTPMNTPKSTTLIKLALLLGAALTFAGCTIQPAVPVTGAASTADGATTTVTSTVKSPVVTDTTTVTSTGPLTDAAASEGASAVTTTTSVVTTTVTTVTAGAATTATVADDAAAITETVPETATDLALLPTPTPSAPLTVTAAVTAPAAVTATTTATTVVTDATAGTILQVINSTPGLESLATALVASGMATGLDQPGPVTFFAPNNDAFAAISPEQFDALLADPTTLAPILQYHIIIDNVSQTGLGTLGAALSSSGLPITVTVQTDGSLLINEATLVQGDIAASNGVIHIIDGVLLPPAPTP